MKKYGLFKWTVLSMTLCLAVQAGAAEDIALFDIGGMEDEYLYTPGYAVRPEPVVSRDGLTLVKDVDYTLAYSDHTDAGTARVTVTGIGNYTGTLTRHFAVVNATRSVGYKLWDSNNGLVATTVPSEIREDGQVMHVQIKFDGVIHTEASEEELRSQFDIRLPGLLAPEDAGREVVFGINRLDPTVLDITMPSVSVTAQTNGAITLRAVSAAGWITALRDAEGRAVNLLPIQSVQPTGLALERVNGVTGSVSVPASVIYRMSSIPLVRGMNFLQARSNRSNHPGGWLAKEYFTIHSHSFFTMTPAVHFTTLTGAANVDTLQKAGYRLEAVETPDDENSPCIRLTALRPAAGEELSWVVYHYPYRAPEDRKFELALLLDTAQADPSVLSAAREVLYDIHATAEEVSAAIAGFDPGGDTYAGLPEGRPEWRVGSESRAVTVWNVTPGSLITVYRINGSIAASLVAASDRETIPVATQGIYIVRVDDSAVKIFVK
ncbi:MAG: DUF6383 domain-containing protein [Tannerella sp.]|nr:DUF6383 domain-containing protein [Tannerella sp.]